MRDVVISGDAAGWWMVVVVKKKKSLFVHDVHVSFQQMPLTRHSIKRMVAYMIYYVKFYLMLCHSPFIYKNKL